MRLSAACPDHGVRRVWSWPGNTTDSALIRQAKADLREWTLARIVWVGDRGFTSGGQPE